SRSSNDCKIIEHNTHNLLTNDLTVIVYNLVDMLSHARTEMEVLKELAGDEISYRSLTVSWFEHSPLYRALKKVAEKDIQLLITTDHGTTRVKTPSKCVGDRATTANLRYKHGRNLHYDDKDVLAYRDLIVACMHRQNVSSVIIFTKVYVFHCFPYHYHHYVNYNRPKFQPGGNYLEEMIIHIVQLKATPTQV